MKSVDVSAYLDSDHNNFIKPVVVLYPGRGVPKPRASDLSQFRDIQVLSIPLNSHFRHLRPRNLPWTHWPVTFDVVAEINAKAVDADCELNVSSAVVRDTLLNQSHFIVDLRFVHPEDHCTLARAISRFMVIRKSMAPEKPILMRHPRQKVFVDVMDSEIADAAMGSLRLEHNYACNFNVIGNSVLEKCFDHRFDQFNSAPRFWHRQADIASHARDKWTNASSTILDAPVALQVLFALRDATDADGTQNYSSFDQFDGNSKFSAGSRLRGNEWRGSGKYPSFLMEGRNLGFLFGQFWGLGLIEVSFDEKTVRLTGSGHRFLEVMHRTNDDPDSLLRFLDPISRCIPDSSCDRVDEWMLRFFRKMKQKGT
ncbi:hypothetical protein [Rhizobium sp. MHM7A]|uniref:hypothetical protein n=1 Tax=Rhizobium sp. MHM7A TaxID=2583233 RepID=UPI0011066282|nr:hypothetical protein [Rhizobium sp. MHM7A]TLX16678.1 hypothetical protein FFR93_04870 [Rhizobium sp. MHM7A]